VHELIRNDRALYSVFVLLSIHTIFFPPAPGATDEDTNFMRKHFPKFAEAEQTYDYPSTPMPYTPRTPYSAWGFGHEMDRIPPTPGTTGGIKSPVGATSYGIYAPHAGYATDEAAKERERGVSQYGMAPVGQTVPMAMPPVTPRTKAFKALEGGGDQPNMPNKMKAEWGKREVGNLPWSGRDSGGRKSGGSYNG
jgi:hypothetical protein